MSEVLQENQAFLDVPLSTRLRDLIPHPEELKPTNFNLKRSFLDFGHKTAKAVIKIGTITLEFIIIITFNRNIS